MQCPKCGGVYIRDCNNFGYDENSWTCVNAQCHFHESINQLLSRQQSEIESLRRKLEIAVEALREYQSPNWYEEVKYAYDETELGRNLIHTAGPIYAQDALDKIKEVGNE